MAAQFLGTGIMEHQLRALAPFILTAALIAPLAHADGLTDRIFSSGFMPALVIEGNADYPVPIAHARVEAHFGEAVGVATTTVNGSYRVGLEIDQIDPRVIVELFVRGTGAQASIVWASPLGPANRLLALAGSSLHIGFDQDPFVHLSPRSTVAAAAARAFNGWQPITDEATFWRAIRSRQNVTDDLVYALALVTHGALPLPNGVDDTFEAVSSLQPSQSLYQAYWSLRQTEYCVESSQSPFCDVSRNLALDAQMFPTITWTSGVLYSQVTAFRSLEREELAVRPNALGATVLPSNGATVPAIVTVLDDGGYELAPADGSAFQSEEEWIRDAHAELVRTLRQVTRLYVKLTRGPGGQIEFSRSSDFKRIYIDRPGAPADYIPYERAVMPRLSTSDPLPSVLTPYVPSMAARRWALTSPLELQRNASGELGLHGYDVHSFQTSSGHAERSGQPFMFNVTSPTSFTVDSDGRHAEFLFLNEEESGVWQMRMHVTGENYENVVTGLLVSVDAGVFAASNVPGIWRSRIYGDICSGPYGDLGGCYLDGLSFLFRPDGGMSRLYEWGPSDGTGSWSLAGDGNAGRLLFEWGSPFLPSIYDRRGWELIHENDNHRWVLETFNHSDGVDPAPPVVFNPTMRLVRYDRE